MIDLKKLLRENRVVEILSPVDNESMIGVVYSDETTIETPYGTYYIRDFSDESLKHYCETIIIRIYAQSPKGLELIWDRERDFTDWSTIPVDTKIQVREFDTESWVNRYFADYKNGLVYAYDDGLSSFTTIREDITSWSNARLYKEESEDSNNG